MDSQFDVKLLLASTLSYLFQNLFNELQNSETVLKLECRNIKSIG